MIPRLVIVGFLLCFLSNGSVVFVASAEEKPIRVLPFLSLLLQDDSIRLLGSPDNIQTTTSDIVSCSRAAFDSKGNAYVVWIQGPNYSSGSVWASRHTSNSGWGTAAAIESSPADIWGCPAISADGNGNVFAVWSQSGVIMLNHYLTGIGWSTPETVGGSMGLHPSVAVDTSGTVFVVWEDSESIWARRYKVGVGWDTATTIESYTPQANMPSVVVDASGNATVVWSQNVIGLLASATANHYTVGAGWGTPVSISSGSEVILNSLVIADIDANGNVFASWSQGSPETYPSTTIFTIRANRYVPGGGWGVPVTLDTDLSKTSNSPNIAAGASGDATVVWGKYDKTIYTAMYSTGTGWEAATAVAGGSISPDVAISSTGKVTVAWDNLQNNYEYDTRAIQYTSSTGWGDVQLLAPINSPSISVVTLATDGAGNFLAPWTEGPGPTHDKVMINLFQ